jgi:hypothetical protein
LNRTLGALNIHGGVGRTFIFLSYIKKHAFSKKL